MSTHVYPVTRIEFYRRMRGMGKVELGRLAGMSASYISGIEKGAVIPNRDEEKRLAEALGVSSDFIAHRLPDFNVRRPRTDCGNIRCRVREARKRKGWTQEKLAARTGIAVSRISGIETGRDAAELEEALCLAEMLGCGIESLFERKKKGLMGYPGEAIPSNLVGARFGKLTVIRRADSAIGERRKGWWICKCDCGEVCKARGDRLIGGRTTSCGCEDGGAAAWGGPSADARNLAGE